MKIYPLEIISDQKGNVLRVLLNNGETWELLGECQRCGKCCERGTCEYFKHEMLNGKMVAKCDIEIRKPWSCKFSFTNPYDEKEVIPGCAYKWRRIT